MEDKGEVLKPSTPLKTMEQISQEKFNNPVKVSLRERLQKEKQEDIGKLKVARELPPPPEPIKEINLDEIKPSSSTIPDMVEQSPASSKEDNKPKPEDIIEAQELGLVVQNEIPLSPAAKENISKLKGILDKPGWEDVVDSETGVVTSQALVIEPVLKKYASQVQIAIDTKQGFGMVDTAEITHKPPNHKDETSTVVATVSIERVNGREVGGLNKWEKSQYLANGDIVTTTHFMNDIGGGNDPYVRILYKNENPKLLEELVQKNSGLRLYPNEAAINTHFQEAINRFKDNNGDAIKDIISRYPDNPEGAQQSILTVISSRSAWDKTISDEDKLVLGYAANMELEKTKAS